MSLNYSCSKHQLLRLILVPATLILSLGITGCCAFFQPSPVRAPEQFPETEIVFVAGNGRMGFVNADGSALTYITLWANSEDEDYRYGSLPIVTNDGTTLIYVLTRTTNIGEPYIGGLGKLVVATTGEYPDVCEAWYAKAPLLVDNELLSLNIESSMLELYDLHYCEDSLDAVPMREYEAPIWESTGQEERIPLFGLISPNLQYMAYSTVEIVIRNLLSGDEISVGEGDYPAWSRDSQWLSYVGHDGIYIVEADGTGRRQVVTSNYSNSMIYQSSTFYYTPPWPAWSPDGHWLIYHLYNSDSGSSIPDEIPIYKLNIETGEVIKIVDYGIFPSWRWPAVNGSP